MATADDPDLTPQAWAVAKALYATAAVGLFLAGHLLIYEVLLECAICFLLLAYVLGKPSVEPEEAVDFLEWISTGEGSPTGVYRVVPTYGDIFEEAAGSKLKLISRLSRGPDARAVGSVLLKGIVLGWLLTLARLSVQSPSTVAAREIVETGLGLLVLPPFLFATSLSASIAPRGQSEIIVWPYGWPDEAPPEFRRMNIKLYLVGVAVILFLGSLPFLAGAGVHLLYPIGPLEQVADWRPWDP